MELKEGFFQEIERERCVDVGLVYLPERSLV
jgi:hypothetical protein